MKQRLIIVLVVLSTLNIFLWFHKQKPREPITRPPIQQQPVNPFNPLPPQEESKPSPALPDFVQVPTYRQISENSVYADVVSHSKGQPFGDAHGRSTNAHETAHGIHSELRNSYAQKLGKRVNGFYCLNGRGVIVDEPRIRKRDVNKFVPEKLRSYRWGTYLEGQTAWDDTPTYICDEWVAYVLGGMTCVDDVKQGRHKGGWTDGVSGCLDFSIYTVALCMAIQQGDPEYWKTNRQFRSFVVYMLKQANQTYLEGHQMSQFKWDKQDTLFREWMTSASGESMRNFMRQELEGVWLDPITVDAVPYAQN